MKLNKILLLILIILNGVLAIAQLPPGFRQLKDAETIKKSILETNERTTSLSCDFIQEKHLTMMQEILVSKGRFLFKKDNNVHWEYYSPINYSILINNHQFVIDNDGKISSFDTESNKLFKEINNMILMAIQGNFVNDPNFRAAFYENESHYLVKLKPQDEILKNILDTIEIYFNKTDMAVSKVNFIEPEEDFTLITFTNRKKNITINDDQFRISQQ